MTYLSPVRSLPARLTTAVLNTKLEKMVNSPATPVNRQKTVDHCSHGQKNHILVTKT